MLLAEPHHDTNYPQKLVLFLQDMLDTANLMMKPDNTTKLQHRSDECSVDDNHCIDA